MRYIILKFCFLVFISCKSQTKFTEKFTKIFEPPMDSLVFKIVGPYIVNGDSVFCSRLHYTSEFYCNDTIIDSGKKIPKFNVKNKEQSYELFSGTPVNHSYYRYKATDYNIKVEYWFEYYTKD